MATERERAQATVKRLESEIAAAETVLQLHKKTEKEDAARGYNKVGPARAAATNARRALDIAKADLRRLS